MNHFAVRRAGVLLAKAAFLLFGLAAIWMMLSLVEPDGIYPWWLVTLASVGSMSVGCCFLLGALICEDELNEDERRAQKVPVRKIERRPRSKASARTPAWAVRA